MKTVFPKEIKCIYSMCVVCVLFNFISLLILEVDLSAM